MKIFGLTTFLLILLLMTCISCSKVKKPEGMPELFPCEIKLTQEGQPLSDASILCMSDDPKLIRWAVTGKTDAKGVAKIFTMGRFAGIPAGTFAVVLSKEETVGAGDASAPDIGAMATSTSRDVFSHISLEQTTKERTPHKITIEGKGASSFEFDCGKKVRIQRPKEAI